MHLDPGGTVLVPFPSGGKFVLRVLSCKNEELLVKPGLEPQPQGIVTIEVK